MSGPGANGARAAAAAKPESVHLELVSALLLLVIGGVFLAASGTKVADWIFPLALIYLTLLCGVILLARALLTVVRQRGLGTLDLGPGIGRTTRDVVLFTAMVVVAVVLYEGAGFWLMSFLMIVGASIYLTRERSWRALAIAVAAALIVCVLAYAVFILIFYVPLPPGSWWPWSE